VNAFDEGENVNATVGLVDDHNVLRFRASETLDERFAATAAQAVDEYLCESLLQLDDVDVIVAAPGRPRYRTALAARLGVPEEQIIVARDENAHTASLAAAFDRGVGLTRPGGSVLLVAAGAGITAGRCAVSPTDRIGTLSVDRLSYAASQPSWICFRRLSSDPQTGHLERQRTRRVNVDDRVKLFTRTDVVVVTLAFGCR